MKKIILSLLCIGFSASIMAQKPVKFDKDKLGTDYYNVLTRKYKPEAKDYIDKVLQNPKEQNNKEALTYKAVIYAQLASDSATRATTPDGINTANDILMNLQQTTDTAAFNKLMREDGGINAVAVVYSTSFNSGRDYFRESKWDSSYNSFKNSAHWSNYILANGFSQNPDRNALDTITVLYTGYAAQNGSGLDSGAFKNPAMADSAMAIFTQLANRNIHTPEMAAMYQYMIQYYQIKKEDANASKYLALAKEYYPDKNDLWSQMELQAMTAGGVDDLIKNYQDKKAQGNLTEDQYAYIGGNLANAKKGVKDSAKLIEVNNNAIDAFQRAFALDPNNGLYAYNIATLNMQTFQNLEDVYYANTGESAVKKAKRDAIEKQEFPIADTCIYWYDKAYSILSAKIGRTPQDNICGNNSAKSLSMLYQWKSGKEQGRDVTAFKRDEALSNKYSALESSLQ